MIERPAQDYCEFARAVIDAGADVYFGHSAHVLQGIEIYHDRIIVHDAGDFVDDYRVDPQLRNDQGLLFRLRITREGVSMLELIPLSIGYCQVRVAHGADKESTAARIQNLSAEFGTEIRSAPSAIEVPAVAANGEHC